MQRGLKKFATNPRACTYIRNAVGHENSVIDQERAHCAGRSRTHFRTSRSRGVPIVIAPRHVCRTRFCPMLTLTAVTVLTVYPSDRPEAGEPLHRIDVRGPIC
jgi:hypothetical protein